MAELQPVNSKSINEWNEKAVDKHTHISTQRHTSLLNANVCIIRSGFQSVSRVWNGAVRIQNFLVITWCTSGWNGVLSPFLFAIFVDSIVDRVKATGLGCYLNSVRVSILLYADDIVLFAPSVTAIQCLLEVYERESDNIDMLINAKNRTAFGLVRVLNLTAILWLQKITANWSGAAAFATLHQRLYLGVQSVITNRQLTEHSMRHLAKLVGQLQLKWWYSYLIPNASPFYIMALMCVHLLAPKLIPCNLS